MSPSLIQFFSARTIVPILIPDMEMRTHHPSKRGSMEEEDRLSSHPDDLLHSILRELPFKHAVRTSALSRRWAPQRLRALASSRVLDFTDRDLARGQLPARAAAATVRRCLELHAEHGAPLDVFRVALMLPPGSSDGVVGWIASAVARGAREVEVYLTPTPTPTLRGQVPDADDGSAAFVELPGDLFVARNSLARLAPGGFSLRAVPAAPIGLAGLRSLSLSHVDIIGEVVRDVVSSCRALESLSLSSCNLLKQVRISSETLRVLEIVRCPAMREVEVDTPALTSPPAASSDGAFGRDVAGWIASAVARGARDVEVDLAPTKGDDADDGRSAAFVELPGDLFVARNSLVRLALCGFSLRAVLVAAPAGLAGLRSLSLSHADVTDEALGDVVSSCRALESLSLSSCNLLKQVRIASETLRVLEIVRCPAMREVEVDTPALESFAFHGDSLYVRDDDDDGRGFLSSGINLGSQSTPALRDVYLSHIGIDFDDDEREFAYDRLLIRVDHAQVRTLCSVGLRYLGWCEQRPVETNVRELQLLMAAVVVDEEEELQFISNLFYLFRFPLLDRLFIRFPGHATDASDADVAAALAREVADVSKSKIYEADFVLDSLRFIELVNLRGTRRYAKTAQRRHFIL